jgi:hypothetical protein
MAGAQPHPPWTAFIWAVAYMPCEASSPYYRVMTGSPRMPVLIDEQI